MNKYQSLNYKTYFIGLEGKLQEFYKIYKSKDEKVVHNLPNFLKENLRIIKKIIKESIPEMWTFLEKINKGTVCKHVIRMLFCCFCNEDFNKMNDEDKNIIIWSVILHDIKKRGVPIFHGRDFFHPFGSAIVTLKFFLKKDFFLETEKNDVFKLIKILKNSKKRHPDYKNEDFKYCKELMDYRFLDNILILAKKVLKSKFSFFTFMLVAFHQSWDFLKAYPNLSILKKENVRKAFTDELIFYGKVLFVGDSLSYEPYNHDRYVKLRNEIVGELDLLKKMKKKEDDINNNKNCCI